ncbi:MAG: ImmA/IrrE family metallo-endopeptidase [Candidatus Aminicenantes bacterium]|nr:ImmA/IrrE family metallo-endopeptidase [Candidatus Aminicenantes bacterium]
MALKLEISYVSYDELRSLTLSFLKKFRMDQNIPVEIEELLECKLKKNICPIPGLLDTYEIDGWTSNDLTTIYVDEFIYKSRETRYRFTLAHELGHIVLHKDIYETQRISSVEEWRSFCKEVDETSYAWLESQAYNFAGLILVPSVHLEGHFQKILNKFRPRFEAASRKRLTKDKYIDYFIDISSIQLSSIFNVSQDVIEKRLIKDSLITRIP